ncbi:AraC family transcriptional regulator [Archangium lansingense]|uniref:AraC family transcriptional regulator n=1 Tax=Archangium lansingense TaxID=2995310 RepID=A0ABT4AM06_9BACT|nr:AraC family transcriptional regulator [Archangium lansinium]MCY1082742.1 AraC family transcriptional regulator [Archangium lansinium]
MRKKPGHDTQTRLVGLRQSPSADGGAAGHVLRVGCGAEGLERLEASFIGQAFSPHRHDTYAIGMTLTGVQTFRYRGERRHCLAGEGHILHPDELHDGGAGTEEGFGYRIIYVDPSLVQQALGGRPLPFVANPVIKRRDMEPALIACLNDLDEPIGDFERLDIALVIAGALEKHASAPRQKQAPLHLASLLRVRDLIADDPKVQRPVKEFERISGLDRWTIARQFRAAFGTSPTRFRTMRQLDLVRRMINGGLPLCDAALEAGFADQSHMSRMFKRTYGLTPAKWAAALI